MPFTVVIHYGFSTVVINYRLSIVVLPQQLSLSVLSFEKGDNGFVSHGEWKIASGNTL